MFFPPQFIYIRNFLFACFLNCVFYVACVLYMLLFFFILLLWFCGLCTCDICVFSPHDLKHHFHCHIYIYNNNNNNNNNDNNKVVS